MAHAHAQRDPRSIVTPEAFDVSEELLGTVLASPRRRFAALLIDLVVIGVVTLVTRSFALVLGVVAAVFFMRAGFKRTPVRGSVFGRAMRFSVGCLGFFIAVITAIVWSSCGIDFEADPAGGEGDVPALARGGAAARVVEIAATLGLATAFEDAQTLGEAEEVAAGLVAGLREAGLEDGAVRDVLTRAVPGGAAWAGEADALFTRLLEAGPTEAAEPDEPEMAAEIAALSDAQALRAYAELAEAPSLDAEGESRARALRSRLSGVVAVDTLAALGDRIDDLERTNEDREEDLERTREALREATSGGLLGWFREFVDELGFGFGWASLYLTVFLSWWNGQTVGKRLLGIRVVRLDGEPITWWVAFERAGGYAAGFATGLLGFAQVYWDANRQAIHDRIVGTVVVREGAERDMDWEAVI